MESIKDIFLKEKKYLKRQHEQIIQSLNKIYQNLESHFNIAEKSLHSGKFFVNQTFIKEIKHVVEQIQAIIKINTDKGESQLNNSQKRNSNKQVKMETNNPYLIDISVKQASKQFQNEFKVQNFDISTFVNQNRENSHLVLNKKMLESSNPLKISLHCTHLTSIHLKSHSYQQDLMITDIDLNKIGLLNKITSLNISQSSVTDKGISHILKEFSQLKQLDISGCCLITDQTIKKLTGDKLVNLKLNNLNSITFQTVLDLILHSYNLNYLEIQDSRNIKNQKLLIEVSKIYDSNQANFKWLQILSDIGIDLFINKLAYLTHVTSAQVITDRQVSVLMGNQKKNISGLFFCSCEQLNQSTVQLICKQLNTLKRLKLSKFTKLSDNQVKQIVSQFIDLQFLNLDECFSLTNNVLKFISQFCSKLTHLSLVSCRAINDEGLQYLNNTLNKLEYLDLSNLKIITDKGVTIISKNCNNLKSLILEKCDQITDQSINEISSRITNLEELVVNYCQNLTDSSLSLVSTRLRSLTRLQIQWCQVSQKCVGYIAQNLTQLKIINLNFCPSVCDKEIQIIAKSSKNKIQVLKLQSCDKISEEAFLILSQSSKNLRYLDLRQCIGVTDDVIKSFCASAQGRIKFMDLSWCTQITDKSLFSISQYQHQLISLNLSGCSEITDIGIEWIITTLKNLQYLNISLCERVTDKSVSLISQLRNLRRLYICDLKRITDVSISNLSDLTGLQELHISGCSEISSSSLLAILHNLEKLSGLNINQCSSIKAQFLSIMLDKLKNLRKLQMSSLQIDDQFLENIGRNLQKLQYLNVSLCGKITDNGLIRLVQQVPSLIRVDFQNTSINSRTKQKIVHTLNCRRMYNITLD